MDHWDEIRKLIVARRADRLAEKVTALDHEGRKEVAARLPELLKELRGRFDRWDDGLALLRATGVVPPRHDPLVAGWVDREPSRLGADPLLDHLLPRLFEAEGVGRVLQWERACRWSTRCSAFPGTGPGPSTSNGGPRCCPRTARSPPRTSCRTC
ncbi:hypothetical protein [Microtetraspora niveoalba]|uniref:hypothetical protein n=1 Tax=Microtetraspora niveoalba TaxID=46175 RepID=UPI00082E4195|nr:hypothetical protein [Microtetraspora niveoalba]